MQQLSLHSQTSTRPRRPGYRSVCRGTWSLAGVLALLLVLILTTPGSAVSFYQQSNLVSDIPGLAATMDPNLQNPWGIASSATSPFWIADNGTGVSTLYNGKGQPSPVASPLVVTIPPPAGGTPPSAPTGLVFNSGTNFQVVPDRPARFIFATEDGTISGWNPTANMTNAILKVDNSASGAVYKGLAINTAETFLYAADFHAGTIDVFDSSFAPAALSGSFIDPNIPAGFAPFNIQNLGGSLYVTYAKQNAQQEDDIAGPGNGFVDLFDADGNLLRRLVTQGVLNSPWGLAIAPTTFGDFSNALLVGNFGDGMIHAFDPGTGALLGTLRDSLGQPLVIEGLWGLRVGNGRNDLDPGLVYFTAGIPTPGGIDIEAHGLFGSLQAVPEPSTLALLSAGTMGLLGWRLRTQRRGHTGV